MFDRFKEINWNPDRSELRQFGKTLLIGFPFAALIWYCLVRWFYGEWIWAVPVWITGIGWTIAVLAFLSPTAPARAQLILQSALAS